MASPTRWMWVWVNSGSWWWIGRPGVLWFMETQSWPRLSNWTELNWTSNSQSILPWPVLPLGNHKSVLLVKRVKALVSQSCLTLCDPMDCSHQASPSMKFSRQEYWSRWPFPTPRDLLNPGVELGSPSLQADSLPSEPPGKPLFSILHSYYLVSSSQ